MSEMGLAGWRRWVTWPVDGREGSLRGSGLLPKLLLRGAGLLLCVGIIAAASGSDFAGAESDGRLTNLSHLDFLGDGVVPPQQEGHTTYRISDEPRLRTLWTYAEPEGSGAYRRVGGGAYDPATGTWG
ncbi:MAG: hypothetical protein H0U55_01975, partial [Rubrobacteraceae bacterium]|nr:hypothetical protein [Rubrobacteraceae bacterium]